ncbi:hypothetical protein OsJ_14014 [Oryza sativa Japonica Group]|uniref:B1168G10.3 protein n=1 Tax=Oryza sativa subsp. japonica TaxID=39947 RepID=Q5H9W7_ORYSJ|nr:hypothetical protein OsJ_14014 [Oryza sativa Japonica Group]KAF2932804.1 hypothetical protein DAI22_04g027350 [Oryza sativa Japonica Group]CAI44619.1 B1168G10.3 [Oryza sativa Japonica Group]
MTILLLVAFFCRIKKQAAMAAKNKRKKQPKLPPGPATMPVLGNMHQMLMNKPVFRWIHRLLDEMDIEIRSETLIFLVFLPFPVHQIGTAPSSSFRSSSGCHWGEARMSGGVGADQWHQRRAGSCQRARQVGGRRDDGHFASITELE